MALRRPLVAGQFYAGSREELLSQIEGCFQDELGPGKLPDEPVSGKENLLKLIISPHAGFMCSGPCAAWAYKEIKESRKPDAIILLGPSHAGENTCLSAADWETPLGIIKAHKELVSSASKNLDIPVDEEAHEGEHSIEVQLPFIQYIYKDAPEIIPLMVSHNNFRFGEKLKEWIMVSKKEILIIVSSDFTHHGPAYGYMPFMDNPRKGMYEFDKKAIDLIVSKQKEELFSYITDKNATICGALPIYLGLNTLAKEEGKLLKYYISGDITKDYTNSVGYAAISFK